MSLKEVKKKPIMKVKNTKEVEMNNFSVYI